MDFTSPTTKTEMYNTLQDIFHYYRVERQLYLPVSLTPLSLTRWSFTPSTDTELTDKAERIVKAEQDKLILDEKAKINEEIAELTAKLSSISASATAEINEVGSMYDASEQKVRDEATKKGLVNSSITVDKIAEMEVKKNAKIADITAVKNAKLSDVNGRITALNTRLSGLSTYYQTYFESMVDKKFIELEDAELKKADEVFKYNNGLSEKEDRSENSIIETNANLQIKYMSIFANSFSKEQLVDMGYYDDVVKCVTDYYDTLSASNAFNDIKNEGKLAIYLEDFYQNVIYMYKVRAGV